MAKDRLIDSHVSEAQCKQAVDALYQWASKQVVKEAENELLPGKEPLVWLNVALKQMPSGEVRSFKPVRIPIKHPLVDPRTSGVCLLTKDPQRQYKDLLEEKNIKFVSRVVGLEKLKGKFNAYEARRALLKENGLFLADDRIIPLLPKLLGTKWFEAKKQPIPVCLTRKDLKAELERAISSTYMNQNRGTAVSIKIGTISQKPSQILDNLIAAIPAVASHIKGGGGGWDNVQSLGIKTSNSVHLPIWSCSLDDAEGGRYDGLTVADDDVEMEDDSDDESEAEAEVEVPAPVPAAKKGQKKRAAEDEDEDQTEKEKPKKKAKAQESEPKAPATAQGKPDGNKSKTKKPIEPEIPAPAPESKVDDASSKKKRRKFDAPSEPVTPSTVPKKPAPAAISTHDTSSGSTNKKSKKNAAATPLSAAISTAMEVDSTPSIVKTKKAVAVETAPTPANTPASADVKSKKKKGRASLAGEPEDATTPVVEETPKGDKKKKRKFINSAESEAEKFVAEAVTAAAADSETPKQKKKSRKSVSVEEIEPISETPKPAAEDSAPALTKNAKKKEKRKSLVSADAELPVPQQTPKKDEVSTDAPEKPSETPGEKKKRRKVKKHGESGDDVQEKIAAIETLTKEELKQKKAVSTGEKKKEKVVKAKAGKRAKDGVLGKKVAQ